MKLLLLLSISLPLWAKRVAPPIIAPLKVAGSEITFEVKGSPCPETNQVCGIKVDLLSTNLKSGKVIWKTELYQKIYNQELEADVQDVHPYSLKLLKNGNLEILNEKGSKFLVNSKTGKLLEPLKSIIYPK